MLVKEPKTSDEAVKPLVYLNCLIGIGAYRPPNMSDVAYFCMQLYTVIIFFTNWIVSYIGLILITSIADLFESSPMANMMNLVLIYTNACFAVASPFLIWRQNKGLLDSLQHIPILDDTFEGIFGARNEYRKQYIHLFYRIMAIIVAVFVSCFCVTALIFLDKVSLIDSFPIAFTLHYPVIVMLVMDLNFCTFVRYLGKKFRDLNHSLLELAEQPSTLYCSKKVLVISRKASKMTPGFRRKGQSWINDNHHLLHEMRKAHLELCNLTSKINAAFGIQNLLSMGISFVMVTGLLYMTYSAVIWKDLTNNKTKEVIPPIIWFLIFGAKIWVVNHSCWVVSNEAERTGEVIYELLETRVDTQLQKQMQEFGVQMLQNPVRFNACGFFTLDYTFVQGVIGSITTYLVILIQMSHLSESPTTTTSPAWNVSEISLNS